jgi:hypothetical protein
LSHRYGKKTTAKPQPDRAQFLSKSGEKTVDTPSIPRFIHSAWIFDTEIARPVVGAQTAVVALLAETSKLAGDRRTIPTRNRITGS